VGPLQTLSSSFSFLLESTSETTVSFEGAEDKEGPLASRLETDPANWYTEKIYTRLYSAIGASNRVIEQLDSSRVTATLNQATKDLVKARVKFARALSYLYLVQLYGEVPLILSTADATDATASKTRVAIDKVYEQIIKDLTEAEADLPDYDIIRSNPSKGAANGLLARAYLVWGQNPLTQEQVAAIASATADPEHSVNADRLQKAVEYADKVITSGNYGLLEDYNRNFGVGGENQGNEHIFTIHHDGDGIDAQGNHQTHCPFTERFDLWVDNHIGPADVTLVDIFDSSDKRKLYSIVTELWNADEPDTLTVGRKYSYKKYEYKFPVTSPRFGKFIHRNGYAENQREIAPGTQAGQPNNINRIELRYAEVLLYKAEALLFLSKAGEALPLVNQLRSRAGVTPLTSLDKEALFKEWFLELSFEQKQWTNLVRWKTLIASVNKVKQYEYYKEGYKDADAVVATAKAANGNLNGNDINADFFAKIYKHLHAKADNIKGKHYRFPIPTNGGINSGVSPQNPGY
jgi:hypothetical protein